MRLITLDIDSNMNYYNEYSEYSNVLRIASVLGHMKSAKLSPTGEAQWNLMPSLQPDLTWGESHFKQTALISDEIMFSMNEMPIIGMYI